MPGLAAVPLDQLISGTMPQRPRDVNAMQDGEHALLDVGRGVRASVCHPWDTGEKNGSKMEAS